MTIAIVGFGPRGLACLENLMLELSKVETTSSVDILVFETSDELGTGKAWDSNQPETNYINISDHALQNLKGREKIVWKTAAIPSFPSYTQWCIDNNMVENIADDKDVYPSRAQMGTYLNQRAKSMCDVLQNTEVLKIMQEEVEHLAFSEAKITLTTKKDSYTADECLLTLGHQPTKDSDETKKFKAHAKKGEAVYIHNPYEEVIARDDLSNKTVAIKGFGLSMLDVTRQLTNYKFGTFTKKKEGPFLTFTPKQGCVAKIIPYSYDGLPPVPKPFGRTVDNRFEPTMVQKNSFELALRNRLAAVETVQDATFLLKSFAPVAAAIFKKIRKVSAPTSEIEALIIDWLQDTDTKHELILNTALPVKDYMVQCVQMAYGTKEATLDYTIGQVWRHLQPTMYRNFAFSGLSAKVMKEVVDLDETSKRYSYGPPVESLLQLIALVDATILDLDYASDPEVSLTKTGWDFKKNDKTERVQLLCNSVMDAPVLAEIDSTLVSHLRDKHIVQEVYEGLGVRTKPDGTLVIEGYTHERIPIALIGRNAKGSVLGADAILECFSPEIHDWAKGVVNS